MPTAVLLLPHALLVHVYARQKLSVPHCAALLQSTQVPVPLQKSPLPQAKLSAWFGLLGVPALHTSLVQGLPSTGTSVLKTAFTATPAPLHSCTRQSPVVWLPGGRSVPLAVLLVPQVLLLHVKV